jgi:hypothetical protein
MAMQADKERAQKRDEEMALSIKSGTTTPKIASLGTPRSVRTPRRLGM